MSKELLNRAISLLGTQQALAEAINKHRKEILPGQPVREISQSHIAQWLRRSNGKVPPDYCIPIEIATNAEVTRYDLRPDVFGQRAA